MNFPSPDKSEFTWIGSTRSNDDAFLTQNRDRIEVLGGWSDDQPYEYNEVALVRIVDDSGVLVYYALTTAGCSYPSPDETWTVDYGPATLDELRDWCAKDARADDLTPLLTDEYLANGPREQ